MKKTIKTILTILAVPLSLLGLLFIALIIHYYPVIDRLFIQPCAHYPQAFLDCKEKK